MVSPVHYQWGLSSSGVINAQSTASCRCACVLVCKLWVFNYFPLSIESHPLDSYTMVDVKPSWRSHGAACAVLSCTAAYQDSMLVMTKVVGSRNILAWHAHACFLCLWCTLGYLRRKMRTSACWGVAEEIVFCQNTVFANGLNSHLS